MNAALLCVPPDPCNQTGTYFSKCGRRKLVAFYSSSGPTDQKSVEKSTAALAIISIKHFAPFTGVQRRQQLAFQFNLSAEKKRKNQ